MKVTFEFTIEHPNLNQKDLENYFSGILDWAGKFGKVSNKKMHLKQ